MAKGSRRAFTNDARQARELIRFTIVASRQRLRALTEIGVARSRLHAIDPFASCNGRGADGASAKTYLEWLARSRNSDFSCDNSCSLVPASGSPSRLRADDLGRPSPTANAWGRLGAWPRRSLMNYDAARKDQALSSILGQLDRMDDLLRRLLNAAGRDATRRRQTQAFPGGLRDGARRSFERKRSCA